MRNSAVLENKLVERRPNRQPAGDDGRSRYNAFPSIISRVSNYHGRVYFEAGPDWSWKILDQP